MSGAGHLSGPLVVVMGVSGCGKSTVGAALAEQLDGVFIDGDDLHPPDNVAKMAGGHALTDADRVPWLDRVGQELSAGEGPVVIACSALKRAYRDRIRHAAGRIVTFVHLCGPREILARRLNARPGHFMPPALLDSQIATLEPIESDERAVTVSIVQPPAQIVVDARRKIAMLSGQ